MVFEKLKQKVSGSLHRHHHGSHSSHHQHDGEHGDIETQEGQHDELFTHTEHVTKIRRVGTPPAALTVAPLTASTETVPVTTTAGTTVVGTTMVQPPLLQQQQQQAVVMVVQMPTAAAASSSGGGDAASQPAKLQMTTEELTATAQQLVNSLHAAQLSGTQPQVFMAQPGGVAVPFGTAVASSSHHHHRQRSVSTSSSSSSSSAGSASSHHKKKKDGLGGTTLTGKLAEWTSNVAVAGSIAASVAGKVKKAVAGEQYDDDDKTGAEKAGEHLEKLAEHADTYAGREEDGSHNVVGQGLAVAGIVKEAKKAKEAMKRGDSLVEEGHIVQAHRPVGQVIRDAFHHHSKPHKHSRKVKSAHGAVADASTQVPPPEFEEAHVYYEKSMTDKVVDKVADKVDKVVDFVKDKIGITGEKESTSDPARVMAAESLPQRQLSAAVPLSSALPSSTDLYESANESISTPLASSYEDRVVEREYNTDTGMQQVVTTTTSSTPTADVEQPQQLSLVDKISQAAHSVAQGASDAVHKFTDNLLLEAEYVKDKVHDTVAGHGDESGDVAPAPTVTTSTTTTTVDRRNNEADVRQVETTAPSGPSTSEKVSDFVKDTAHKVAEEAHVIQDAVKTGVAVVAEKAAHVGEVVQEKVRLATSRERAGPVDTTDEYGERESNITPTPPRIVEQQQQQQRIRVDEDTLVHQTASMRLRDDDVRRKPTIDSHLADDAAVGDAGRLRDAAAPRMVEKTVTIKSDKFVTVEKPVGGGAGDARSRSPNTVVKAMQNTQLGGYAAGAEHHKKPLTKFAWRHTRDASDVRVTGSFNDWQPDGIPLSRQTDGTFAGEFLLPSGEYDYKFLVDKQWRYDPDLPSKTNEFGELNNVVRID